MNKPHWELVFVAMMLAFSAGICHELQGLLGGMAILMTWGALL